LTPVKSSTRTDQSSSRIDVELNSAYLSHPGEDGGADIRIPADPRQAVDQIETVRLLANVIEFVRTIERQDDNPAPFLELYKVAHGLSLFVRYSWTSIITARPLARSMPSGSQISASAVTIRRPERTRGPLPISRETRIGR
jgi:hypothetical protein